MRGIERDDVERGQVLAKPGSIKPHTEFESEVYVLTKDEGGRHTPFFKGYKPQFYFRTTDVTQEPTVLPPSLIANLNHSVIAIGDCNLTVILILSPGITISTPSSKVTAPVTSVVRK